jgi:organic hydroperoxide reductase OsmC/OhrA
MLASVPHRYTATLCRTFSSRARFEALPQLPDATPPLGSDPASPEHMLLSSLGLCMLTTFEAFAARDRIELLAWHARVHGTVEQTTEGPAFTSIVLELDIDIAGNVDQFEDTLEDAKRYCLVQNALRVPVVVETVVRTPCDPLRTADDDIPLCPRLPHDGRALHAV